MNEDHCVSWETAQHLLLQWHEARLPNVGRAVFTFIEEELRLMIPPLVQRTWPEDLIEDALRSFLTRLIERPLTHEINNLRSYLRRTFNNHCIDCHRARMRMPEIPFEPHLHEGRHLDDNLSSKLDQMLVADEHKRLHAAMARLPIRDRIALKLELAPEWLSEEEASWLAARAGSSMAHVWDAIRDAADMHALTRIFDPDEDDPLHPESRRRRMERFRRCRERARARLHELFKEESQ
jgi:DNA-directed RNA polymerase specialized sigma24 family protein